MVHYRRVWDESRGDEFDSWGTATYYFEVDENGTVKRQFEQYTNGRFLAYDEAHPEDEFGGLSNQPLDRAEWAPFEIDADTFEAETRGSPRNQR